MKPAWSVIVVLLLFVLCLPLVSFAETYFFFSDEETTPVEIENPDFRNTKWGMTKEEVIAQEAGREIISIEEMSPDSKENVNNSPSYIVSYRDTVKMIPTSVLYGFNENDILIAANYLFTPQYSYAQYGLYVKDYYEIKEILIEKYGQPKDGDERWINTAFKNSEKDVAFSVGALAFYNEWETDTTFINMVLYNDTSTNIITFGVKYEAKNFMAPEKDNKL